MVGEFRERTLRNSERELENTVLLLTRHFDQQFEDAKFITNDLIAQMQLAGSLRPKLSSARCPTPDTHLMLKSKVSALSYIGDVNIYDSDGTLINSSGDWPSCRPSTSPIAPISRPSNRTSEHAAGRTGSQPLFRRLRTVIARRLSGPNGEFLGVMSRRDRPGEFRKFLLIGRARKGRRDFHVPSRWNDAGAPPARRFDDRAEIQDGTAAHEGPDRGRPADPARAKSRRRSGPARLGGRVEPFPDRGRRDHDGLGGAGRLARANQIPDRRRRPVRAGDRHHSVPDHPADDPAKSGIAAAAGIGEAPARHRAEQHDAGPRAV